MCSKKERRTPARFALDYDHVCSCGCAGAPALIAYKANVDYPTVPVSHIAAARKADVEVFTPDEGE